MPTFMFLCYSSLVISDVINTVTATVALCEHFEFRQFLETVWLSMLSFSESMRGWMGGIRGDTWDRDNVEPCSI